MKASVIYDHQTATILAIQYDQETAISDVRNVIIEINEGERITGLTINDNNVTPMVEESQESMLVKEVKALTAQVAYLQMMSGIETEVGHE